MSLCADPSTDLGVIRSVLGTVDCHVRHYSEAGYLALTGPQSFFPAALTALMTIYVALLGFRLMFGIGQARLTDAPVMAVKIGLILTLTLNWAPFQTLVFDLTSRAPLDVARIISGPARSSGSALSASPLDGLQAAYDQLAVDAAAFGKAAGPNPQVLSGGVAQAADSLWGAQKALFMSSAGVMSIASIAVGVLATIGPIFIALLLFESTRGLFAGWLRAILAAALTPMLSWIATTVLLVVLDPWLEALSRARLAGDLDLSAATVVSSVIFIFAFAQGALAFGAAVIASGFQFGQARSSRASAAAVQVASGPSPVMSRPEQLAMQLQRMMGSGGGSPRLAASGGTRGVGAPAGGGARLAAGPGSSGQPQAARLGDTYLRGGYLDRFRPSPGGAR